MRETTEKSEKLRQEDRMMALGRVSTGIAHEIRNPLSTINVYTKMLMEMLSGHKDKETLFDILNEIGAASERIENVVKRVMDFAKPRKPEVKLSDINHCIREVASLSNMALQNEDILLKIELDEKIPKFYFENQSIMQVLLNLISNGVEALKIANPPKQISISSQLGNNSVMIRVSDTGPGISQEHLDKVFDPFFTTKHTGLGIGLSLCDRIVRDHGGNLTVSNNHHGAEFHVTLPIHENS